MDSTVGRRRGGHQSLISGELDCVPTPENMVKAIEASWNANLRLHHRPRRIAQAASDRIAALSRKVIAMNAVSFEKKIVAPDAIAAAVARLPRPLVFTNGCFDILHRGHVTLLAQARELGESLIVAVNSDASVKRQGKGDDRPVNRLEDRLALIAALECVALVTWFDEDTPLQRVLECRPDVLVKGGDWAVDKIVGNLEVAGWGGRTVSIPFIHQKSTTALLDKIRRL